jgi:hypothetical protein
MADWDRERELHESILAARFNFFVVFFGIVIVGAVSAEKQEHLQAILSVGCIVCLLIALTIVRIQMKTDYVIRQLHLAEPEGAAKKVHDEVKGPSLRWIICKNQPLPGQSSPLRN